MHICSFLANLNKKFIFLAMQTPIPLKQPTKFLKLMIKDSHFETTPKEITA